MRIKKGALRRGSLLPLTVPQACWVFFTQRGRAVSSQNAQGLAPCNQCDWPSSVLLPVGRAWGLPGLGSPSSGGEPGGEPSWGCPSVVASLWAPPLLPAG